VKSSAFYLQFTANSSQGQTHKQTDRCTDAGPPIHIQTVTFLKAFSNTLQFAMFVRINKILDILKNFSTKYKI